MVSVWALCVIVFVLSDLGFVLSLREVELRTRSWCPEVALEISGITFSVSRGRRSCCWILVGLWVSRRSFGLFRREVFGVQRSVWEILIDGRLRSLVRAWC